MEKYIKNNAINNETIGNLVGDSHRYKNEKGEISCVHPCLATMDLYEIYCIKGDLFEDIERYDTLNEAEERISELLEEAV